MEDREREKKSKRKKRTKEEMEKAYRIITLADMTRPARFGSTRGWKLNPDGFLLSVNGPEIPGMRKRRRKKRTFEKITCDDDVRVGKRGYWRYSWRQTMDDLDEPVAVAEIWNNNDI